MKQKYVAIACAGALVFGGMLAGCSSEAEEAVPTEPAQEEPAEPEYQIVGKEAEGAYEILMTNTLDKEITSIHIKLPEETDFPAGLMAEGDKIAVGDTVKLYYTPEDESVELYDILVGFDDDTTLLIEQVKLSDIAEMSLHSQDDLGYVEYTDKDGKEGSTLQEALDRKAAAEAALAQAQAEAEAAAAAEAEAAAAQNYDSSQTYTEPYTETYQEPQTDTSTSQPSQSEDQCVEGGVALR